MFDFNLPSSDPNNPNSYVMTPEQRSIRLAAALRQQQEGSDTSPIRSPWQGAARLAQALMGGLDEGQLNAQQAAGQKTANDSTNAMVQALMGGTPGAGASPSTPSPAPGTPAMSATPSDAAQTASNDFS